MRDGAKATFEPGAAGDAAAYKEPDITTDEHGFTVLVRNALFRILRALGRKDWAAAAESVTVTGTDEPWDAPRFERAFSPFFAEHTATPAGRFRESPESDSD